MKFYERDRDELAAFFLSSSFFPLNLSSPPLRKLFRGRLDRFPDWPSKKLATSCRRRFLSLEKIWQICRKKKRSVENIAMTMMGWHVHRWNQSRRFRKRIEWLLFHGDPCQVLPLVVETYFLTILLVIVYIIYRSVFSCLLRSGKVHAILFKGARAVLVGHVPDKCMIVWTCLQCGGEFFFLLVIEVLTNATRLHGNTR